jgi:hypothetical protein
VERVLLEKIEDRLPPLKEIDDMLPPPEEIVDRVSG